MTEHIEESDHNEMISNALSYLDNGSLGKLDSWFGAVYLINKAKGWYDSDRTFGDDMALLHSEVSEAFEAFRKHGTADVTRENHQKCWTGGKHDKIKCQWGLQSGECQYLQQKPEGVGSELADVLVRLLDTCHRYNIDLESEFKRKVRYNATRPYRHGNRRV